MTEPRATLHTSASHAVGVAIDNFPEYNYDVPIDKMDYFS